MGTHVIKMPDIGEGIAQVELVEWFVKVGDTVSEDQVVADVMTDKATVEIPSPVAGTVMSLGGAPGDVMAVGSDLIRIAVAGETPQAHTDTAQLEQALPANASTQAPQEPQPEADVPPTASRAEPAPTGIEAGPGEALEMVAPTASRAEPAPTGIEVGPGEALGLVAPTASRAEPAPTGVDDRVGPALAAPAVRKRAADLGIDLQGINGTGPQGQVVHADLDAMLQRSAVTPSGETADQHIPVIGMRRKIAERMQDSKRRVAHFSYVEEVDVSALESLRAELNRRWGESRGRLTLLPLLVRALVVAVREFPQINARYDDDAQVITRHGAVHLGIATQSDNGLMVPVLRNAQGNDLWRNANEIQRLADAARRGKAVREELSGSTLTLSSLGALGGIASTPVINTPEVAIVGVNRIVERPVVIDGQIAIRKMMNLSSSFDHRVIDGMDAAKFIQAVKRLLEQPASLFID